MMKGAFSEFVNLIRPFHIFYRSNIKELEQIMSKTKIQKQKVNVKCLKTKDKAAYLESEQKRKKKRLEQLKKDEAAYNLHLQKNRLGKAVYAESNFSFS